MTARTLAVFGLTIALTLAMSMQTPAQAQDSRYSGSTWGPPGTGGTSADIIGELKTLINEAERARAADRRFIGDLRDLVARYERPWTRRLFLDDFSDGEIDRNPTWRVTSGKFWVEPRFGLRSLGSAPETNQQTQKLNEKELAKQLLGSILNQALTGNSTGGTTATPAPASAAPAVAFLDGLITNAFAVSMNFTSWKAEGRFEVGVHQNNTGTNGYRVAYVPGTQPRLELLKVTTRGTTVIDTASGLPALEDEKIHSLLWTRAADGTQMIAIDGKNWLQTRDASFRDPFRGLVVLNAGGDFILRDIEVLGTP